MTASEVRMALPTSDPRCGSKAGYTAHWRRGENACEACRVANTEAMREHRERGRTSKKPTPDPRCGTRSGVGRHMRRGETLCGPCGDENRLMRLAQAPVPKTRPPLPPSDAFDEAACYPAVKIRPGLMLHDTRQRGETDDQWQARLRQARTVCRTCPALTACHQLRDHYKGRRNGIDGILAGQPAPAPPYNTKEKPWSPS